MFHVYIDRRLDTNAIFYVGKGNDARIKAQVRKNRHHTHIRLKHGLSREIVFSTEYETLALINEELLRAKLTADGVALVNVRKGMSREYIPLTEEESRLRVERWRKSPNIITNAQTQWRKAAAASRKQIVCVESGVIFESISKAALELGIKRQNIHAVLSGKRKRIKNLTFIYKD